MLLLGVGTGFTLFCLDKFSRKAVLVLTILGTVLSVATAVLRNATSSVDSAILNGYIYAAALISTLCFFLFYAISAKTGKLIINRISWIFFGMIMATVVAYGMPDVWGYPYHILLVEETVVSTDFLMSLIGMLLACALAVVMFFAAMKVTAKSTKITAFVLTSALIIINASLRASGLISVLFQKKIIVSNHIMFSYTVFVKNHSDLFVFVGFFVFLAAAILLFKRSVTQKEPYNNPAEQRKILAKWKFARRWVYTALICGLFFVLNLTVVDAMSQTDVTLSPIEDATSQDDENMYVDFSLVEDGHLHRFAYTSDSGTQIRFIIIKKPNSSSYGVGLDACDVCGETGYYERDGQVVCNLCDVVMNISTIGFKGGCNPIVIPWSIENGQIVVPIEGLLEYESEFK